MSTIDPIVPISFSTITKQSAYLEREKNIGFYYLIVSSLSKEKTSFFISKYNQTTSILERSLLNE
jgi:hypothetical protein